MVKRLNVLTVEDYDMYLLIVLVLRISKSLYRRLGVTRTLTRVIPILLRTTSMTKMFVLHLLLL